MTRHASVVVSHLPEHLDSAAVSAIRGDAALHPAARCLIVDAARVARFDPVGVLRLWEFCAEQTNRGVRIELTHLHPVLAYRLRAHPLLQFTAGEDQVFADPFATREASQR